MKKKDRKERDYPMLGAALKSLRHGEFAKFYGVYGRLQIGWGIFSSRVEWDQFHKWMRPHIDNLLTRRISYRVFRDELADYIERMANPKTHEKLIVLARETYNCHDDKELYELGKKLFLEDDYGKRN